MENRSRRRDLDASIGDLADQQRPTGGQQISQIQQISHGRSSPAAGTVESKQQWPISVSVSFIIDVFIRSSRPATIKGNETVWASIHGGQRIHGRRRLQRQSTTSIWAVFHPQSRSATHQIETIISINSTADLKNPTPSIIWQRQQNQTTAMLKLETGQQATDGGPSSTATSSENFQQPPAHCNRVSSKHGPPSSSWLNGQHRSQQGSQPVGSSGRKQQTPIGRFGLQIISVRTQIVNSGNDGSFNNARTRLSISSHPQFHSDTAYGEHVTISMTIWAEAELGRPRQANYE
ncbi:hypothetical protein ACLOJK_028204 [Asimina triloba]